MANLEKSLELLVQVEHSGKKEKLLHKNEGENGLTFFGIYQSANPEWKGWDIINRYLANEPDLKKCSVILSNVTDLKKLVIQLYKYKYWDKAMLDLVESQKIADEIFIFGVNVGMKVAIKKAQELVGVEADGIVGEKTINALNNYNEIMFDIKFDDKEKEYYDILVKKPNLTKYKQGWYNRAEKV